MSHLNETNGRKSIKLIHKILYDKKNGSSGVRTQAPFGNGT